MEKKLIFNKNLGDKNQIRIYSFQECIAYEIQYEIEGYMHVMNAETVIEFKGELATSMCEEYLRKIFNLDLDLENLEEND